MALLVGLAWLANPVLHAQVTYTSTPGQTSIYSFYDPNAPAPKAPATRSDPVTKPFLPAIPMDQYLALKAEMAKYSQSSFALPSRMEISSQGPLPLAPSTPGPVASTPLYSWQGLTDTGQEPASPDIAVGPSDVLMVVNANLAQFTKSGTLVKMNSLQDWFSDVLSATCPSNCFVYDPWIVYDQLHGRFVLLASTTLSDPASRTSSFLLISVSNGATYAGGWKNWSMNASLDGSVFTQNWGDSWRLGYDSAAVYLSGNMFNSAGQFQYAKIRVVKKSDLYNPALATLPYQELGSAQGKLKNLDNSIADSLIPVRLRGVPNSTTAPFFVNAAALSVQPASYVTVWQLSNPVITPVTVTSSYVNGLLSYKAPAPAPQLASAVPLATGDTRVLKAVYRSGFLYTARNSGYSDQATTVTYDVINTSTMKVASQARAMNVNAFYPSFDVPATVPLGAQFATGNQITGTTTDSNGNLVYAGLSNNLKAGESSFFVQSSCSPACRWGDYFGGTVDPISGGLWVSGQYAKPPSIVSGIGQWGTWAGYYPWLTTQAFTDVPSSSLFFDFINVLSSWQITSGCSTSPALFCPTNLVTRDQLATFIIKCMLGNSSNFSYTQTPYFTDVPPSSPFFPYIQKLRDLGLTQGCTTTTYCPTSPVLRMDASVLIVRGKLESLFGDNFTYPTTPFFTDVPSTMPQFKYIQKMYELGITTGCTATTFCPNNNLTRQEIATFLTRAFLN